MAPWSEGNKNNNYLSVTGTIEAMVFSQSSI